jgi:hypothetical protein
MGGENVKKTLIIGSILAAFLMTMIPIASAINSHYVKETSPIQNTMNVPDLDFEKLKEKYTNNPTEPTPILITLLILLLKFIRAGIVATLGVILIILRRIRNNTAIN